MIESTDVQADVSVLYKLLTPVIASQLLAAHYNRLALSRALGDDRNEEETLKEVLSDFLVFSELVEKSIDSLDRLDPDKAVIRLKARRSAP